MEKKVEEIKKLFTDLFIIVQRYGDNSLNPSKEILKQILSILEGGDAPADKLSKVKFWYGCLFFPKSQMSEFYIWREDFDERVKINRPLDDIRDRLWELLK